MFGWDSNGRRIFNNWNMTRRVTTGIWSGKEGMLRNANPPTYRSRLSAVGPSLSTTESKHGRGGRKFTKV